MSTQIVVCSEGKNVCARFLWEMVGGRACFHLLDKRLIREEEVGVGGGEGDESADLDSGV